MPTPRGLGAPPDMPDTTTKPETGAQYIPSAPSAPTPDNSLKDGISQLQASGSNLERAPVENTITTVVIGVALLAAIIGLIIGTGDAYTLGLVATGLAGALGGSTMQSVRR